MSWRRLKSHRACLRICAFRGQPVLVAEARARLIATRRGIGLALPRAPFGPRALHSNRSLLAGPARTLSVRRLRSSGRCASRCSRCSGPCVVLPRAGGAASGVAVGRGGTVCNARSRAPPRAVDRAAAPQLLCLPNCTCPLTARKSPSETCCGRPRPRRGRWSSGALVIAGRSEALLCARRLREAGVDPSVPVRTPRLTAHAGRPSTMCPVAPARCAGVTPRRGASPDSGASPRQGASPGHRASPDSAASPDRRASARRRVHCTRRASRVSRPPVAA